VGAYTSLAFDSYDNPNISYIDLTNYDLKYARWNGFSWEIEAVTDAVYFTSLELDSSDNPHISFSTTYYPTTNLAKHTFWNGSTWETTTLWGASYSLLPSLDLDSSDKPHILVIDGIGLRWYQRYGSSWEYESFYPPQVWVSEYFSFLLDSSDNPHISFSNEHNDNDNLMYAYYNPLWIEDDPILFECSLIGASPNPTSGNVSMHFSIPEPSLVGFTVFNIAGRLISEIQRNEYSEGSHFVQLDEFAPGIYFCRMISEDFTATQQFVVLE